MEIEEHFKFLVHSVATKVLKMGRNGYISEMDNKRVFKENMKLPRASLRVDGGSATTNSNSPFP